MKSFLTSRWEASGIESGDMVLIHSSIGRTIRDLRKSGLDFTPADILDSLLSSVSQAGTLIFPLFNFDFTKGTAFNIKSTPSHMGALSEAARLHPEVVRTGHPIYSFGVIGKKANLFEGVDNLSGYADDSPFGILRRSGGKIAVIDLPDQNSMTFYHHVEEVRQVPYRYFKDFTGNYVDAGGAEALKTYRLYVRDIEQGVLTFVNPAGEMMWKNNLYSGSRPGEGAGMRVVRAQDMFDHTAQIIDAGLAEGMLFRFESRGEDK